MTKIVNLGSKKEWIVAGKKVKVDKIEDTSFDMSAELSKKRVGFEDLEPNKALSNVVANVAQLSNGSFLEKGVSTTIIARISDVVGSTLIRTNWEIPANVFNNVASQLQVTKNLKEEMFYVTSKVS